MAYSLDPEVFEDTDIEPIFSEDEDWYEDPGSFDFVGDPAPTTEELNDMYYYFNDTYDDPIRMCEIPSRSL